MEAELPPRGVLGGEMKTQGCGAGTSSVPDQWPPSVVSGPGTAQSLWPCDLSYSLSLLFPHPVTVGAPHTVCTLPCDDVDVLG